ncbi:MAG: histidine kinase N-terminal 7TM domain-containing protein [Anaerolineales bacterium]
MELYPYYIGYIVVLLGGSLMGFLLLIRIWRMRSAPGAYGLMLAVVSAVVWSLAYMMEIARFDLAEKILWAKLEYFGSAYVTLGIFLFSMHYSGQGKWVTPNRSAALGIIASAQLFATLTNERHHLVWADVQLTNGLPFGPLSVTHGAGFVFIVLFQYALVALATLLFFQIATRTQSLYQKQARVMLAGMAFPCLANMMYVSGLNPVPSLDLTPIALTFANLFLSISFLRYRLMDLQPVAHISVFNAIEDGVVVLDYKERIVDINPVGSFIFQNTSNLIGREIAAVLPKWQEWKDKNPRGEIGEEINIELQSGQPSTFKLRTTSVIDQTGKRSGRVLLMTDVTEQKRASEQLAEASRLKSHLLASFGHDLRSPLGAIIGYAEMIKDGSFGVVSVEQGKAASEILDSANQLLSFINNLVGQAQIETGKAILREFPFDVEEVIGPLLATLNFHAHKKGLALVQLIDPALPKRLVGDQFWLRQIVMNLVHNAVKFTEKGSVTVRFIKADEAHWAIQVVDTGAGIPEDAQRRVFQAFEQVQSLETSKQGGFGLGLSIVAKLASIMNGKIELKSEVGKGSSFTVILPLKESATEC